ncbi:hypothetical protein [Methanolobus chelungpuianus]|uniref:hypothetical protein n=1 Tax=Methanolobus chelungpuianus TaxID=502115 RepID=UPI00211462C3|nr:hypothetical protein [Methanolobus chelungpuianus]
MPFKRIPTGIAELDRLFESGYPGRSRASGQGTSRLGNGTGFLGKGCGNYTSENALH